MYCIGCAFVYFSTSFIWFCLTRDNRLSPPGDPNDFRTISGLGKMPGQLSQLLNLKAFQGTAQLRPADAAESSLIIALSCPSSPPQAAFCVLPVARGKASSLSCASVPRARRQNDLCRCHVSGREGAPFPLAGPSFLNAA